MLDPKSFSITAAAFLPGPPETDPPGYVVAPVRYNPAIGIPVLIPHLAAFLPRLTQVSLRPTQQVSQSN